MRLQIRQAREKPFAKNNHGWKKMRTFQVVFPIDVPKSDGGKNETAFAASSAKMLVE